MSHKAYFLVTDLKYGQVFTEDATGEVEPLKSMGWIQLMSGPKKGYFVSSNAMSSLSLGEELSKGILSLYKVEKSLFKTRYTEQAFNFNSKNIVDGLVSFEKLKGEKELVINNYLFVVCFLSLIFIIFSFLGWVRFFKGSSWVMILSALIIFGTLFFFLSKTQPNIGPDEPMHIGSSVWYSSFLLPPSVSSKNYYVNKDWKSSYIFGTTSDLSYLVTARLSELLSFLGLSRGYMSLRMAQFLTFLLLLGFVSLLSGLVFAQTLLLMFALIPQLGFLLTYYNGDALSFMFSFFGLSLICNYEKRTVNLFVKISVGLFLILASKLNYITLIPVFLYLMYRQLEKVKQSDVVKGLLAVLLLSPVFFYRRLFNFIDQHYYGKSYLDVVWSRFVQASENGWPVSALIEESVRTRFHSLTDLDLSLLFDLRWYAMSFVSFFGLFGQMDVMLPIWALGILILGSFAFFYLGIKETSKIEIGLIFLVAMTTVAASLYYSMSHGYQAQGRYLFSIIVAVGLLFANGNHSRQNLFLCFLPVTLYCFYYFLKTPYFVERALLN